MSHEIKTLIKAEIKKLTEARFIRKAQYTEWLSNIVPVMKKNGKLHLCIDLRNLNLATPKDEYPMLMADISIDVTSRNIFLSLMDGHLGSN